MLDNLEHIECGEKRYPMAFTLNVMEAVQEQYKSMSEWAKLIQNADEPNIKAIKFMLTETINEGFDIEEKDEKITSKQVGRLISRVGIAEVGEKIKNLISKSLPENDSSKNAKTTRSRKV